MKELVELIAKSLVDYPDEVVVKRDNRWRYHNNRTERCRR